MEYKMELREVKILKEVNFSHNGNGIILRTDIDSLFEQLERRKYSVPGAIESAAPCNALTIDYFADRVLISCKGDICEYNGEMSSSDLYPIFFAAVYSYFAESGTLGIHSVLVERDSKGLLVIGGFGQGKTTLALEFEKHGWRIVSADQTELCLSGDKVYAVSGSRLMKWKEQCWLLDAGAKFPVEITGVISVRGLCTNGIQAVKSVSRFENKFRQLWNAVYWPWATPTFLLDRPIDFGRDNTSQWCARSCRRLAELPLFEVRGDGAQIARYFSQTNKIINE